MCCFLLCCHCSLRQKALINSHEGDLRCCPGGTFQVADAPCGSRRGSLAAMSLFSSTRRSSVVMKAICDADLAVHFKLQMHIVCVSVCRRRKPSVVAWNPSVVACTFLEARCRRRKPGVAAWNHGVAAWNPCVAAWIPGVAAPKWPPRAGESAL